MATLKGAIPLPKSKNADYHTLPDERTPTDHQHTLDLASSISTARDHEQDEGVDEEEDEGHGIIRVGVNKGKGRAREDVDLDTFDASPQHELANLQPPAHRPGSRANANNSSVDGDISVNTGPRDMYLSPHTAEMNRGVSPPSTSSSSTPTNNTSTSNSNHVHPHGQAHTRHKSKIGREKDPRWDLDTMETPNPGRSRSPLADEYTEPHWNSRTGTHSQSGQGHNNDRDAHGQRGMEVSESAGSFAGIGSGDYPSQSEEVEEERRIQDNLASLAAKEAARRRAARSSKAFVTRPSGGFAYTPYEADPPGMGVSTSTSSGFARRASGWFGGLGASVPGFGRLGGVQEEQDGVRRGTRLPHSDSHSTSAYGEPIPQSPIPSPIPGPSSISRGPSPIPRPPSTNPFESDLDSVLETNSARASPTRSQQPGIDLEPRARGNAEAGPSRSNITTSSSSRSTIVQKPRPDAQLERIVSSASTLTNDGYVRMEEPGWKGPTWRGGAGADSPTTPTTLELDQARYGYPSRMQESSPVFSRIGPVPQSRSRMPMQGGAARDVRRDKWWYALCSWGSELDDGEDGQGGRTNPFE